MAVYAKSLTSLMPRDENGRFLPKEAWTKKEIKDFERAKRYQRNSSNPIKLKKVYGEPIGYKEVFIPPQDEETKQFLPKEYWSTKDWGDYYRAEREGLFPGRFKRKKPKKVKRTKPRPEIKALTKEIKRLRSAIETQIEAPVSFKRYPAVLPGECPECPPSMFELADQIEGVRKTLDEYAGLGSSAANPIEALAIINPAQKISEKLEDVADFIKKHPVIFALGMAAALFSAYMLYRSIKSKLSLSKKGADVVNGQLHFPGVASYQITQDDMVWLARSIWGEVSPSASAWSNPVTRRAGAAVLWAYANHYMTVGQKQEVYSTLGRFVQAYSQPINPAWLDPAGRRCQSMPAACTPQKIQNRRSRRAKSWDSFPPALQELVISFVQGTLANPIGTRTDFRMAGTGYRPADAINIEGNVFGTDPDARLRERVAAV